LVFHSVSNFFAAAAIGATLVCGAAAMWPHPSLADGAHDAAAEKLPIIPLFSSAQYGWLAVDDELKPMMTGPRPVRADPLHPYFSNQNGTQPTFRVSDLSNPILTDWARARMKPGNDKTIAGKFPYSFQPFCTPGGVPGQLLGIFEPVYFVQTPGLVLMIWQRDHAVRHIYMNVPHSRNPKPSWYGESVGYYENSTTLVVDTIGLSTQAPIDNWRTPHSEQLHVVERFSLIDQGESLQAIVTIEDPVALTAPLTVYQVWNKLHGEMIEASCAENNISYYGGADGPTVPVAEKPDF
jgi:hypothetical protein